jgi:hypothetical protein
LFCQVGQSAVIRESQREGETAFKVYSCVNGQDACFIGWLAIEHIGEDNLDGTKLVLRKLYRTSMDEKVRAVDYSKHGLGLFKIAALNQS